MNQVAEAENDFAGADSEPGLSTGHGNDLVVHPLDSGEIGSDASPEFALWIKLATIR